MLEPGCRSGRWISARPVRRARTTSSAGRCRSWSGRPRSCAAAPESSTSASRAPWASKWLRASVNGRPVASASSAITRGGEARRGVDAGADRGAAERQLARPGAASPRAARCRSARGGVAAELLAEHHRGGVHQVRAAGLHHVGELARPWPPARSRGGRARAPGRRRSPTVAATWIDVGKVSLLDWLALTWSLGCTSTPARAASEASTSFMFMFDDVPEPVWKTSIGNCVEVLARRRSRAAASRIASRLLGGDHAELGVDLRGGRLDPRHRVRCARPRGWCR